MELHQVLLALSGVSLSTRHRGHHQSVGIVYEIILVLIRRDIHIVVQTCIESWHLVDRAVKVQIVAASKGSVGRVQSISIVSVLMGHEELLHLPGWRNDHVLCRLLGRLSVVMVMMVVHMTEVRVDEAVSLDLRSWFEVEMLLGVHTLKIAAVALGLMTVMIFWVAMPLALLFFLGYLRLVHPEHNSLMLLLERVILIYHDVMEWCLLWILRWCQHLRRVGDLLKSYLGGSLFFYFLFWLFFG